MGDDLATPYRFPGQREEATIELYFYNARWYDPAIGRFVQADTIVPGAGNPQALNRYSHVFNNPLAYTDPSGHGPFSDLLKKIGNSGPIGKAVIVSMAQVVEYANKLRTTVFYPDEDTSFGERVVACAELGGGAVLVSALPAAGIQAGVVALSAGSAGGAAAEVAAATGGAAAALGADGDPTNEVKTVLDAAQQAINLSSHALERMAMRGVSLDQVRATVANSKPFQYFHAGALKTGYYDPVTKIFVGQVGDTIATVINNVKPQYIENLMEAMP